MYMYIKICIVKNQKVQLNILTLNKLMNAFASIGRLRYCKISEEDGLPDSEVSQKQQNDSKVGPL